MVATLFGALGEVGARLVMAVVLISFLSCTISLQAAAGRLIYSYGRDEMIIGHKLLRRFSRTRAVPVYALLVAAVVPTLIAFGSLISTNALTKIVSFAILGIYASFQMVVLAALRARLKGWKPAGEYRLGRWGLLVNAAALAYGLFAIINICWARTPEAALVRQLHRAAVRRHRRWPPACSTCSPPIITGAATRRRASRSPPPKAAETPGEVAGRLLRQARRVGSAWEEAPTCDRAVVLEFEVRRRDRDPDEAGTSRRGVKQKPAESTACLPGRDEH